MMNTRFSHSRALLCSFVALALCGLVARADEQPAPVPNPTVDGVRGRVMDWVAARQPEKSLLEEVGKLWVFDEAPATEQMFDLTVHTFGLVDPATQKLVADCTLLNAPLLAPEISGVLRDEFGPFYTANMRLFMGRYLVHRKMYDEALAMLEPAGLGDVADPAGLLFARATAQHQLQMKEEGLKTLAQLIDATQGVPVRYLTVATLMRADLEQLADDNLDGISRKMSDVERRLSLGRTGQKVQKKEEEIVAGLDILIKKIEEQMGGGGGGGQGGNSNNPSGPAQDSSVKGSTAPGEVDKKKFSKDGTWGALPEKARARAQQQIGRDFPSHYKEAIERFTKKQADRTAAPKK